MTKKVRARLLNLIQDMRDKQYEPETILTAIENQIRFNKFKASDLTPLTPEEEKYYNSL